MRKGLIKIAQIAAFIFSKMTSPQYLLWEPFSFYARSTTEFTMILVLRQSPTLFSHFMQTSAMYFLNFSPVSRPRSPPDITVSSASYSIEIASNYITACRWRCNKSIAPSMPMSFTSMCITLDRKQGNCSKIPNQTGGRFCHSGTCRRCNKKVLMFLM